MDIKVSIGTTTSRKSIVISNEATPKDALNQANVDYSTATVMLDGSPLNVTEMNTSFAALGITTDCMLIATIKTTNAV